MRRATALPLATVLLTVGCGGSTDPTPAPLPSASPTTVTTPSDTPTFTPSPEPSPSPEPEPGTMPDGYAPDVEPTDVPREAMVPTGASPTGETFAFTDDGVMIAVTWAEPGTRVDRLPRGIAVWRRATSTPYWRPAFVRRHSARDAIAEIQMTTADMTGDRSDDLLLFEGTGGTGACGRWLVVELLARETIFRDELCDARIEPAPPGEPGLVVTASVFRPGDAHCCPSAIRRTTLAWTGDRWRVADRNVSEA
ncbi:MAG TPA: hypothetical protein VFQ40_02420 [Actinomycetota bacterium]|nr:hypothetical protein [Actinomycetota bacterium]